MSDHAVGVCGFGRCGSTMVMTMLVAGGAAPGGATEPPYEGDMDAIYAADQTGKVVKLLDHPTLLGVPYARNWRFVWLDRDPFEQARSYAKFVRAAGIELNAVKLARLVESYERDQPKVLGQLRRHGPVLVLRYERILANPRRAARRLREVWPRLDVNAAAAVVHARDGRCRPDLSAEIAIMRGAS